MFVLIKVYEINVQLEDYIIFRLELFQHIRNVKKFKGYLWEIKTIESFTKIKQKNKKVKRVPVTERILTDVTTELGVSFNEFSAANKSAAMDILLKLFHDRIRHWKNIK